MDPLRSTTPEVRYVTHDPHRIRPSTAGWPGPSTRLLLPLLAATLLGGASAFLAHRHMIDAGVDLRLLSYDSAGYVLHATGFGRALVELDPIQFAREVFRHNGLVLGNAFAIFGFDPVVGVTLSLVSFGLLFPLTLLLCRAAFPRDGIPTGLAACLLLAGAPKLAELASKNLLESMGTTYERSVIRLRHRKTSNATWTA